MSWKHRGKPSTIAKDNVKGPGDLVCNDYLISAQPGLLPKISGNHTRDNISVPCIFKDVYSKFTYVHLMTSCDLEKIVNVKHAFENLAATYGATMKHYNADNGKYAYKGFWDAVYNTNQIFLCVVLVLITKTILLKI